MQSTNLTLPPQELVGRSPMSAFVHQLDRKLNLKHEDEEEEQKYAEVRQIAHQLHQEQGLLPLPTEKPLKAVQKSFIGTPLASANFSPNRDSQSTPSSPSGFKKIGRCLFGKESNEGTSPVTQEHQEPSSSPFTRSPEFKPAPLRRCQSESNVSIRIRKSNSLEDPPFTTNKRLMIEPRMSSPGPEENHQDIPEKPHLGIEIKIDSPDLNISCSQTSNSIYSEMDKENHKKENLSVQIPLPNMKQFTPIPLSPLPRKKLTPKRYNSSLNLRYSADSITLFGPDPKSCPVTPTVISPTASPVLGAKSPYSSALPPLPPLNKNEEAANAHKLALPCTYNNQCHYITVDTMAKVMQGFYKDEIADFHIIDCRFEYEYEGGHIRSAVNIPTIDHLEKTFLNNPPTQKYVLIFHCEFSSQRGPNLYRTLRKKDREIHADTYPELYYPEMYLIEGGYKKFYESYPYLCDPVEYVPMLDSRFKKECKANMSLSKQQKSSKVKRSWSTGCISRATIKEYTQSSLRREQSIADLSICMSSTEVSSQQTPSTPTHPLANELQKMHLDSDESMKF